MPLSYFIGDAAGWTDVTRFVRSARFTKTAPGGFGPASATIRRPLVDFPDLTPGDRWLVTDELGETIHEGFTTRPTPTDDGEETFELRVQGTSQLAVDQERPLPYLSTSLEGFVRSSDVATARTSIVDQSIDEDTGKPKLTVGFPQGSITQNQSRARATDYGLIDAGLTLGGAKMTVVGGQEAGAVDYRMEPQLRDADNNFVSAGVSLPLTTTPQTVTLLAGTDFDPSAASLSLQLRQVAGGATNVTADTVWADWYDVVVAMARLNLFGFPATITTLDGVFAEDVVADLLVRMIPSVDAPASTIESEGGIVLTRIGTAEPVTARRMLEDMLETAARDRTWSIGGSLPGGRFLFSWRIWPTRPRYVLDDRDAVQIEGDEAGDLCNRVVVEWTDGRDQPQSIEVTSAVPELTDRTSGVTRWVDAETVTLPDGMGTEALAQQIAAEVLAERNAEPSSGTAAVARWVLDEWTGERVEPWRIEPGHVVAIRETGLAARLTEAEWDGDTHQMALTFGRPPRSTDDIIADARDRVA